MKTYKSILTLTFLLHIITGYSQAFVPKWETCLGGTEWDETTDIIMVDSS